MMQVKLELIWVVSVLLCCAGWAFQGDFKHAVILGGIIWIVVRMKERE